MCGPIMIGGCGSSGTTLLSHLLNASSAVFCGPELYLLNKKALYQSPFSYSQDDFRLVLSQGMPTVGVLDVDVLASSTCFRPRRSKTFIRNPEDFGLSTDAVCDLAAASGDLPQFVSGFFQTVLAKTGKRRWAEKTPLNCYCVGEFLSAFPLGKYVHVVRDGRDVCISLVKRGMLPAEAVRRWIHDTVIGLSLGKHRRCHVVRYEDLVANTETTLARLISFLGEHEEPQQLVEKAQTQPVLRNTHSTWRLQPNEPISQRSVGKWKQPFEGKRWFECLFKHTILSEEVTRRLGLQGMYNANAVLLEFGYDPSDHWNTNPGCSGRVLRHYLRERFHRLLPNWKLYCQVSLDGRTGSRCQGSGAR